MHFYTRLAIFLIFITGCLEQAPQSISSSQDTSDSRNSKQACLKSNLKTNLLDQKNSVAIFECIGWDREYPNLFKMIREFPTTEYAKLTKLPNQILFGEKDNKDKFFSILEKHGTKDDFKGLNSLITLIARPQGLVASLGAINQELLASNSSQSLWRLIQSEPFNHKMIKTLLLLKNNINLKKEDFNSYEPITQSETFHALKVALVDASVKAIKDNSNTIKLSKLIYQDQWPFQWLQQLSDKEFLDLFLFVGELPLDISSNAKIVRDSIFSEFICDEYSGTYVFDHGKEMYERMHKLIDMDINSFYADYMDLLQSYSLFKNVCSRKASRDLMMRSFISAADQIFTVAHNAFSMHGGFELIKNIAKVSLDKTQVSSASLLDLMYSDFFKSYMNLIVHLKGEYDFEGYLSTWTNQFKNVDNQTLKSLSELILQLAENDFLGESLEKVWSDISFNNKIRLINVALDLLLELKSMHSVEGLFDEINQEFPGLLNVANSNLTVREYDTILEYVANSIQSAELQKEIKTFFSSKAFFQLTELMGQFNPQRQPEQALDSGRDRSYVLDADEELESCFAWLGDKLKNGVDFWSLIDGYPAKCERRVGNYLSTHVLNWTLIIDDKFIDLTDRKFSVPYGVIAPDMMEYYLDLILLVNKYVVHGDKYVERIVETMDKHLFEYGFIQALDTGLDLVNYVNDHTKFMSSFLYKVAVRDFDRDIDLDQDLKKLIKEWYYFQPAPSPTNLPPLCEKLNAGISSLTCLGKDDVSSYYKKFSKILLEKNKNGENALGVMLEALYPSKSFKVPYDSRKYHHYTLKLDHLVRYIYDLTDPKYSKTVKFYGPNKVQIFNATIGERLEVVIREIDFLNNFYGAHFMNTVSRAKKYQKKVRSLKSQMSILGRVGGFLRRRGILPAESEWKIKNVLENYDSLAEVANKFSQPDGGTYSYQDVMQTLMIIAVRASRPESTDFNAIRLPKAELANGHRSKIITMGTELSAITRLGNLMRRYFPSQTEILQDKDFQRVSENLHNYFSYDVVNDLLTFVLDNKNTNMLVGDLYNIVEDLTTEQVKQLLSIASNVFKIFDVKTAGALDKYAPLVKKLIEHYPIIRDHLNGVDVSSFLRGIDNFSSVFVNYKKRDSFTYFGSLLQEVIDENLEKIQQLIGDQFFWSSIKKVALATDHYLATSPELENAEVVIELLQDDMLDFETCIKVVQRVYAQEGNLDYFDQILLVLANSENKRSNLYLALEEIFKNKKTPLIEFLESVLSKVSHKE